MKSVLFILSFMVGLSATEVADISQKDVLASIHNHMKKGMSLVRNDKQGNTMTKEEIALEKEISLKSGETINEDMQFLDLSSKEGK